MGALFVAALVVRMWLPWATVFDQGAVYFFDGDCNVHMRKVLLHIAAFPRFVSFDPYEGYPAGAEAVWAPLLDWLWAALCLVLGAGKPTAALVERVLALTPPVIGAMGAVASAYLARRVIGSEVAALICGATLAVMPAHFGATVLGRPDNEMIEPLMTALMLIAYLRMTSWRGVIVAALTGFAMLLFWRGATLWMGFIAAFALIDITLDKSQTHKRAGAMFAGMAGAIALMAITNIWGRQNTVSFNVLSWFHVMLFGLCAVCLWGYGELRARYGGSWVLYPALVLGAALAIVAVPALGDNLVRGLGVVGIGGRRDAWIDSVIQYGPMFVTGNVSFMTPIWDMGWAFWLMPLAAIYLAWGLYRKGYDRGRALGALFIAGIFVLCIVRRRFTNVGSIAVALAAALIVHEIYRARGKALAASVWALMSYPLLIGAYSLHDTYPAGRINGPEQAAAAWMRTHTPSPGAPYSGARPSYAVMAEWDMAGWLEYPSERAVIATMYGTEAPGMRDAAEFYLETDEQRADAILGRTQAGYVVLSQDIADVATYAGLLGRNASEFMIRRPDGYDYGPRYSELVATRLLLADGSDTEIDGVSFEAVHGLRLVYESPEPMHIEGFRRHVSAIKIYERVPGAVLLVHAAPGAEVIASAEITTNIGRTFSYALRQRAGADGIARLRVPYVARYAAMGMEVDVTEADAGRELDMTRIIGH